MKTPLAPPQTPCPNCGADPTQRRWSEFRPGYAGTTVRISSPKHSYAGTVVVPLVCRQCGYVQLFVPPEDFA